MAKRERDGWRVEENKAGSFVIGNGHSACCVNTTKSGRVSVFATGGALTPARAIQFAAKVREIAAQAANKEAKR